MKNDIINVEIDNLRKILNKQIENNENSKNIIETSKKIDDLINIYYKSVSFK